MYITYIEIPTFFLFFVYQIQRPGIGLGFFVIAFIFTMTGIYLLCLTIFTKFIIKRGLSLFVIFSLIALNVLPVVVHLYLLDQI